MLIYNVALCVECTIHLVIPILRKLCIIIEAKDKV